MTEVMLAPQIAEPIIAYIPFYRLGEAEKKFSVANRRLGKAGLPLFAPEYERYDRKVTKGGIELPDGTKAFGTEVTEPWVKITLADIKITAGHYTFVAALVGEEAGYTVHCAPGQSLDGWVRPAADDIHCDHCNLNRNRKRLYIIRDDRDDSLHQIGHSCIELYTGLSIKGLWALGFEAELRGLESDEGGGGSRDYGAPVNEVLALAFSFADEGRSYRSVKAAEFDGNSTVALVREALFSPPRPPQRSHYRSGGYEKAVQAYENFLAKVEAAKGYLEDTELIAGIKASAETLKAGTDYADNMAVILAGESGYVSGRNVGILSSLVAVYAREKELRVERERAPQAAEGFLAPIGTRVKGISLTLKTVKSWEGQYGWTTLLVGWTPEGNVVKWFASGEKDYEAGDTITLDATVKAQENYQGTDQTVITRGRILAV